MFRGDRAGQGSQREHASGALARSEDALASLSSDKRLCGAIHGRGSGRTSALSSKCLRNRNLQVTENIDAIFYPLKRSAVRLRSGQGLVRSFSARPSTNGLPARFLIVAGPRPITMSCAGAGRNITQPFKWMLILYRCWKDHRPYSEEVYLASLAKRHLPLKRLVKSVQMP